MCTLALTYAHTHTQAHSLTYARAHARAHARTRSYYLPVVNGTPQRTPTVLYAHGSCGSRVDINRAEACCIVRVSVRSSCVSGASPPFAAGRPRLDATSPCRSPSPSLQWTALCAAHAPRLARRRTRVFELVALASPCQSRPCTGVRALRGRGESPLSQAISVT
jgi:hypothetical protein